MPGFPFLKLPALVQLNVVKQAEIADVITLSFSSRNMKNLVRAANIQLTELTFWFNTTDFHITCTGTRRSTFLQFRWRRKRRRGDVNKLRLSDKMMMFSAQSPHVVLFKTVGSFDSVADRVTEHLLGIFRRIGGIQLVCSGKKIENMPFWKYHNSIDSICAFEDPETLSIEQVKFIFEKTKISVRIWPRLVDGFRYSEGFKQKRVHIDHSEWIHFDAILNSTSSEILLGRVPGPRAAEMNNLLKLWIAKEKMENLEQFYLGLDKNDNGITGEIFEEIMEGIGYEEVEPYDVKVQRCDGTVARIEMFSFNFYFNVESV